MEALNREKTEDLDNDINDPSLRQGAASNPMESIWVGASAGTGKTKVLTDRVLRLLLPRSDGRDATPPNRILCITFTKAGANEMSVRISETLGKWAVMELGELKGVLAKLLGSAPSQEQLDTAQRLFADVIDCAGGLQIMTIHSFCQSVLGRFPLEADLPPNFTLLDDAMAASMMRQAQSQVLDLAQDDSSAGSPLSSALHALASNMDEDRFTGLIGNICKERSQLYKLFDRYINATGVYAAICEYYDIAQGIDPSDIIEGFCSSLCINAGGLRDVAEAMLQDKGKTAPVYGGGILRWLDASLEGRVQDFDDYRAVFVKKDGDMRTGGFPTKGVLKACPDAADILRVEAQRLIEISEQIKRIKSAQMTRDLLIIGYEVLEQYSKLKQQKGELDFDDLIIRTMNLLQGKTKSFAQLGLGEAGDVTPWIMYKLDQGLDHILVDEAQDTNPEQWRIIEALCEEFFSGNSARDEVMRTSFTVGDIKQSIYSFQRAAPEELSV